MNARWFRGAGDARESADPPRALDRSPVDWRSNRNCVLFSVNPINLILISSLSDWGGLCLPVLYFNDWFRILLRDVHG